MFRHSLIAMSMLVFSATAPASEPLVVHEWGTFTSLQDEQGTAIGRINTDDEPVPAFVHQLGNSTLFPATLSFSSSAKGVPEGDPNVTMRLETPVLYFHLPKTQPTSETFSVKIAFRGGWLTQYFPDAHAEVLDTTPDAPLPPLDSKTVGKLSWSGLSLASNSGIAPTTTDRVWTAPRAVESASITAGAEREQFLFYRGVGHLDAPIHVVRKENTLEIHSDSDAVMIPKLWLVDVLADGSVASRSIRGVGPDKRGTTPAEFAPQDYAHQNLAALRLSLHQALTAEGLFDDEADALLNTWERSYFRNPGERVFFLVPQSWTDGVLPLNISVPANVKRVMVGRIELVTPSQRELLRRMAKAPAPDAKSIKQVTTAMTNLRNNPAQAEAYNALAGGHGRLADLGVAVPPIYADFLALGRFRTALILNSKEPSIVQLAIAFTP